MERGTIVHWTYRRYMKARPFISITKEGIYRGLVKHNVRYNGPQLAGVEFYGNRTMSRVPLTELKVLGEIK